jgi:hypothetical protein
MQALGIDKLCIVEDYITYDLDALEMYISSCYVFADSEIQSTMPAFPQSLVAPMAIGIRKSRRYVVGYVDVVQRERVGYRQSQYPDLRIFRSDRVSSLPYLVRLG